MAQAVCATLLIAVLITLGLLSVRQDWHDQFHAALGIVSHSGESHPHDNSDDKSHHGPLPDHNDHAGCAIDAYGSEGFQQVTDTPEPERIFATVEGLGFPSPGAPVFRFPIQEPPGRAPPYSIL